MRNITNKVAMKLRDSIVLRDHARIRFHETSGASASYSGVRNGTEFSGSITLAAAPTWTDGGAKCPSTNATVYGIATDASHADLVATCTPPVTGGIAFLWAFKQTAYSNNSSTNSDLLVFGNITSGGDGYRIGFVQGANNNVTMGMRGAGGSLVSNTKSANTLNAWVTVQQYLRSDNGNIAAYTAVNGAWSSAATVTDTGAFSHSPPDNYAAVCLFDSMASGPVAGSSFMNKGATDDKIIADLWIVPDTDGSLFGAMGSLATEHQAMFREKLRGLTR